MSTVEPPRPERGATREERGSDASAPEREVAEARTWTQQALAIANPKLVLSQADGYPAGVKQFLQFCLIITYPAWLFMAIILIPVMALAKVGEAILMVLFWPIRAREKRKNPEGYAAFQEELKAREGR